MSPAEQLAKAEMLRMRRNLNQNVGIQQQHWYLLGLVRMLGQYHSAMLQAPWEYVLLVFPITTIDGNCRHI